jgi:YD repeat-containing protein
MTMHEAESVLVGVASLGLNPSHAPRHAYWYERDASGRLVPGVHPGRRRRGPQALRDRVRALTRLRGASRVR